ncbi:MAG: DUF120 domain-containing protein [Desulfurococcaceae archaeon]|jgi:riboflavin kinase
MLTLKATVVSGVGEGRLYVEKYKHVFVELLGGEPYPGTLNVVLEKCFYELLSAKEPIYIKPPAPGLGGAYAYKGWLSGVRVLLVKPVVTMHECRVGEVISTVPLRRLLGLEDGSTVEILIED